MLSLFLLACSGSDPAPTTDADATHAARHDVHEEGGAHGHDHAHDRDNPHAREPGKMGAHGHPQAEHAHHAFDDVEKWVKVFDDPARDAWQKPALVVQTLELQPGMTVADIGAGTGYFNPHLAAAVGEHGKVVAVDIEKKMVDHMRARATKDGTPQVEPRLTSPDSHGLEAAEVDRVLIVDTYHHIADREAYFGSLTKAMKDGGKLVVVDLTAEAPFGPPVEERLSPDAVKGELAAAGWKIERAVDGLDHQYMLVFGL